MHGIVYEMVKEEMLTIYSAPCTEYLEACSKTLSTSFYLSLGEYFDNDIHKLQLEIHRQHDLAHDFNHEFHASLDFLKVDSSTQ